MLESCFSLFFSQLLQGAFNLKTIINVITKRKEKKRKKERKGMFQGFHKFLYVWMYMCHYFDYIHYIWQ